MNHEDEDYVPDFYNLAEQELGNPQEQVCAPYPVKTNKKKTKKKTTKSHVVADRSASGGQRDAVEALPQPDMAIDEEAVIHGLEDADFPPDRHALDDLDFQPASWPEQDSHDHSPILAAAEGRWLDEAVESPAFVSSKRASYTTSRAARVSTPIDHHSVHIDADRHTRPSNSATRTASRRESLPTKSSPTRLFVEPKAPPHMAQPRFYGLPTLDPKLDLTRQKSDGDKAGSNGYCCCFDSLADCGDTASAQKAKDALLVGSEGGLEVFRILSNKVEVVGRLEGLSGSVVDAKIIPLPDADDHLDPIRPLVAVTVHSVLEEGHDGFDIRHKPSPPLHQTSVEIFSLKTQQHVTTLYRTLPVNIRPSNQNERISNSAQAEALLVSAQGRFVTVASRKSGEVFVFTHIADGARSESGFRCIGKVWTSLQTPLEDSTSSSAGANGPVSTTQDQSKGLGVPLLTLSPRWLAIVPPLTSSHVSVQGVPLLSESNPSPPGMSSAVAPAQPLITCEIRGVDAEDAWSRLTRQAAQGVVKYSQKGIELGWQGWKELTSPAPQVHQKHGDKDLDALFPPTKALPEDPLRVGKEPAVISILDLEALLHAESTRSKYPPAPLASFSLPDGCNYLSFSASGLRLFAASRKGELSTIWNLTHCCHGASFLEQNLAAESASNGPCVTQIHQILRSSSMIVVDCAWSRDDDCIAVLTGHGTVHLHEIPVTTSRKRKRRDTGTASTTQKGEPTVSISHGTSPPSSNGGFFGSIRSGWQQMSTQVTGLKAPSSGLGIPTSLAGFRDATASFGSAGGRVLARGLTQGLNAAKGGASDYWHADDNKIRHKGLTEASPRAMKWIKRHSDLFLAVVCQGVVHLHPVQQTHRRKGDDVVSGLKHDKYGSKHFALPTIRTRASIGDGDIAAAPATRHAPHGFWSLRNTNLMGRGKNAAPLARTPTNEVETNPPYVPFHVDARVNIFMFESDDIEDDDHFGALPQRPHNSSLGNYQSNSHDLPGAPSWLFGQPLPPSVKMNTHEDLDYTRHLPHRGSGMGSDTDEEELEDQVKSFLTIQAAEDERNPIVHDDAGEFDAGDGPVDH